MSVHVHIPTQFVSRYSLLGAFAEELARAFVAAGAVVNAARHPPGQRGLFILLNTPERTENIRSWIASTVGDTLNAAILHLHVDHPLALHAPHIDEFVRWPTYRLLMPCRDDAHLLGLRWPRLRHLHCMHGVALDALCPLEPLEAEHRSPAGEGARPVAVALAGSIHSPAELDEMRSRLPEPVREGADHVADLLASSPSMSFTQAFDLGMPSNLQSSDHWRLMESVWKYATAKANTRRRTAIVTAMQGLPALVAGPAAWEPHCTGTIRYAGEIAYAKMAAWLRAARVCVAWGPTQFAHTFSERLLLGMAAGCACVSDDRLLARREFDAPGGKPACLFADASRPDTIRAAVERLLASPDEAVTLARRGRKRVEASHLWLHRIDTFAAAASDAWSPASQG
ncbi:MAG: glycosyltransferase [Phycisphaerae bacterium]